MLDLITHPPSPNSAEAKRAYDRRLLLWPKLCKAVLALKFGSPPKRARATLTVTGTVTVTGSAATRITENVRRFMVLGEKAGIGRARESKAAGTASERESAAPEVNETASLRRSTGGEVASDATTEQSECNPVTPADLAGAALASTGSLRAARLLLLKTLRALEDDGATR
jgi:hypothetical protein